MPGLFDGMRISTSGIQIHRILEEVIGQNIANASNENYTRQDVRLDTLGTVFDGQHQYGQGVKANEIIRIRDELLDIQLRNASSDASKNTKDTEWLKKIEAVFNEPSEFGINNALTEFWESWSDLSNDAESLATRSNVIQRTESLASTVSNIDQKLARYIEDLDREIEQKVSEINVRLEEVRELNKDIFNIEAGTDGTSNDLRDRRDAAIDALSRLSNVSYSEDNNGMFNVYIEGHPTVIGEHVERMITKNNPLDQSELLVSWEFGERISSIKSGELGSLLNIRDHVIPSYRSDLDTLASTLITQANNIYSSGVELSPKTYMESALGYDALDVTSSTQALSLVPTGQYGSVQISFYDQNNKNIRQAGILINPTDSLNDIAAKFDAIPGLNGVLISDTENNGRLSLSLDTVSGENILGEAGFSISNNTGGYDTSGFLNLLQFNQTDKSTNTSAAAPIVSSRDLSELQTVLGEANVTDVRSHVLNMSGIFTLNLYETKTESAGKTDGHLMQQFTINVESIDSIDSILAKINNLTAQYGIGATVNAGDQIEITSTAQVDANNNVVLAGGVEYLRMSFSNSYSYPTVSTDEPPAGYSGVGDNTNLFSKLQMNTLFQGSSASDIALNSRITSPDQIHAGFKLASGDNTLALSMHDLQHARITENNQFTIGESYGNTINTVGSDVQKSERLADNENAMLQSFQNEKDRISGVTLDEELGKMIQFQRSYEANARMFSTFDQLAQELLQIIR